MDKITKIIDGKSIPINISKIQEHNSSENRYFKIRFKSDESNIESILYIGFSKIYLDTQPSADFDKIINEEIDSLLQKQGENIFTGQEYFVYYKSDGRHLDEIFSLL